MDNELIKNPNKHQYMLLSRLQQDCEYYLGYGDRHDKFLWAGNVIDQIKKMKEIYKQLPEDAKPEWLSLEEIEDYEKKMLDIRYARG